MDQFVRLARKFFFGLGLMFLLNACSNDEAAFNFETSELERLLASDSSKSWIRLSRVENGQPQSLADCEIDELLIFSQPESAEDSITVNYETGPVRCSGQADSIIFQGSWDIVAGDLPVTYDSIRFAIEGDTTLRNIDFITSQSLTLSFIEGQSSTQVTETYHLKE